MISEKEFLSFKSNALTKFKNALEDNKIDSEILNILNLINSSDNFYTSSSCSGRILILEIPKVGDKVNARFLGKWHSTTNFEEIEKAIKKAEKGQIWFLAQSPIIHICAKTYDFADFILKIAITSGFKNSGLKSISNKIIIEICSTERIDIPLGFNGNILCNNDYLKFIINTSNDIMKKSRVKLNKFEQSLKEALSTHKSTL